MSSPADFIRERSEKVLDEVLRTEVGFPRMVKQMVAHTIKEYRGRFLHELIQNGYDAHASDSRDGQMAIHFDESESEHGVLYVANGGCPLSKSNFVRMASLGESDKSIGVGIGNKGVGFKSVFQVCSVPEVYSALNSEDTGFSGYSFRFGTLEDLSNLLDGDSEKATKVAENLSLSMLTVPLDTTPSAVLRYREAGYVTVLRLPASSARAAEDIRERIDRLLGSHSPVMLFLERLSTMTIQASSIEKPIILTRQEKPAGKVFSRVILNDDHAYKLFQKQVPSLYLKKALQESVDEGALDERWLSWSAEAYVSVAVEEGETVEHGQAYTYLPMGELAESPISGHVNAPFVTDFARVGLDREQPVNQLLLACIAELCLESGDALIKSDSDAKTVVDLFAWHGSSLDLIKSTCVNIFHCDFSSFVRVPSIRGQWISLDAASVWPRSDCQVFTAEAVAQCSDANLVNPDRLDPSRMVRLTDLAHRLSSPLMPGADNLADWAEKLAIRLQSKAAPLDEWADFYDDLSLLFDSGDLLANRKLLLTEDLTLAPCNERFDVTPTGPLPGRRRRSVFFSPQGTGEGDGVDSDRDIKVPRLLKTRIVFTHPEIPWYRGGQRRPGRDFLENKRLVQPFRTERLLSLLGKVVAHTKSSAVKRDALNFAFNLFAKDPEKHTRELASVALEVPTAHGRWVPAAEARFSQGWLVEGAEELTALALAATSNTPDLAQLREVLLEEPAVLAGPARQTAQWCRFLQVLGVSTQLPIRNILDDRRLPGRQLTARWIAGDDASLGMPREVVDQWRTGISGRGNDRRANTPFVTRDPVYWFAGQHEIVQLPGKLRGIYAELITRALPTLESKHWASTWSPERSNGYLTQIPTPLAAFLQHCPWVPIARPGTDKRDFEAPSNAWYVTMEDHMAASYSPLVEPSLRRLLDKLPDAETHRSNLGLKRWGSSDNAGELINLLTKIFASGELPDTASAHFRSTLAHAWCHVGEPFRRNYPHISDGLLIERSGQIELLKLDDADKESIFITSASDQSATARLVRELGRAYITVDADSPEYLRRIAIVLLQSRWTGDIKVTTEWNLEVLADGIPWSPSESAPRLSEEIPWLPHIIACTMLFPRGSGLRVGKQLSRTLEEIARLRLFKSQSIAVGTSTGEHPLPQRLHGVLPMPGEPPSLLMEQVGPTLTWRQLESLTQGVLELLGLTRFTAELSLTIRTLSAGPNELIFRPENVEIAEALGAPLVQIEETEKLVSGAVVGVAEKIRQVAISLWGENSIDKLHSHSSLTRDDLLQSVTNLCDGDHDKANEIIKLATDSANANALRRNLNISVRDYNESLIAHFPSAKLIDNGPAQQEEFNFRRSYRRGELIDVIRTRRFNHFLQGKQQNDWQELRDLSFLRPDPSWAMTLDDLGDDLIDHTIDQQLVQRLGPVPDPCPHLEDWQCVRDQNGKPLRDMLSSVERILTAWYRKSKGIPAIPTWDETFVETTHQRLDRVGALDFAALDKNSLVLWLERLSIWPVDLEATMDLKRLGLTDEDMNAAKSEQELAREAKRRADRQVLFDGQVVDLEPSMSNWVDTLRDQVSSRPSTLDVPYRWSQLEPLIIAGARTRGKAGNGSRGLQTFRLSDTQRTAIGLAGEYAAFQWLRAKDPSPVDETCWKSASVAYFFDGITGDDSLGYDFEVPRKGGSVMYEVKATSGEAGVIELGETEVESAQEHARTNRWRLLIVEDALSMEPRIYMLPNPFHRDSRSHFSFVGNSLRLRFKLKG